MKNRLAVDPHAYADDEFYNLDLPPSYEARVLPAHRMLHRGPQAAGDMLELAVMLANSGLVEWARSTAYDELWNYLKAAVTTFASLSHFSAAWGSPEARSQIQGPVRKSETVARKVLDGFAARVWSQTRVVPSMPFARVAVPLEARRSRTRFREVSIRCFTPHAAPKGLERPTCYMHQNTEVGMDAAQGQTGSIEDVKRLDDDELIATMRHLLRRERALSAHLLVHLAEFDARGLYRQHAYSSMFEYCVQALHLSEAEAYLRIRAARLGRQFPRALLMLAEGELHLSALKLLAPVLTADNCEQLLSDARLKSKRDVELLLAERSPRPDVPSVIRKLPQPPLVPDRVAQEQTLLSAIPLRAASESSELALRPQLAHNSESQPAPSAPCVSAIKPNPTLTPLGQSRYKLQLTASQQLHDKLRQAQDLMRHELPDGDVAQVLERALDVLIAQRMKQHFGQTPGPRTGRLRVAPRPDSRHVPHAVRRAALARDGARCSYVSPDGRRCEQRGALELHHDQPFGRGGPSTVSNIRVMCRTHNQFLAERDYGPDFMRQRIEQAQRERSASPNPTGPRRSR